MTLPRRPVWPVFVAFVAAVGATLVASLVVVVLAVAVQVMREGPGAAQNLDSVSDLATQPVVFLLTMVVTVLSVGGVALLSSFIETRGLTERLRLHPAPRFAAVAGLGLLALLATGQVLDSAVMLMEVGQDSSLAALSRAALAFPGWAFGLLLLVGGLGAGVGEELLFRGYIQTRLVERWGRWPGIVAASALFGLIHMDLVHSPLAFGIGLGLGWIADRFGSIRPVIVIHGLNNVIAFASARVGLLTFHGPAQQLWAGGVSLALACLFWWLLARVGPHAVRDPGLAAGPEGTPGA